MNNTSLTIIRLEIAETKKELKEIGITPISFEDYVQKNNLQNSKFCNCLHSYLMTLRYELKIKSGRSK